MTPTEQTIKTLLAQLADMQAQKDLLALDKQALIDSILTPEQKAQLADIDAEFSERSTAIDANIAEAQERVKADVQALGKTVKSDHLQAVYINSRVTWNAQALDGFAINHPELFAFRTEGKPSVTLRVVK